MNLLHYDDAASLTSAALSKGNTIGGMTFLGSDGQHITRQDIVDAVIRSLNRPDIIAPEFATKEGILGKRYDNTWTKQKLEWEPQIRLIESITGVHSEARTR